MSYVGHTRNGVVVFDEPVSIPDGTPVDIFVRRVSDEDLSERPSLWDKLKDVVGMAEGLPTDASARIDHYLTHGLPKE